MQYIHHIIFPAPKIPPRLSRQVSYKAIGEDNTPQDVITSPTLGLGSREYLLEDLEPSTEYQVCVHGMAKSLGLVHPHTVGPTAESLRDVSIF